MFAVKLCLLVLQEQHYKASATWWYKHETEKHAKLDWRSSTQGTIGNLVKLGIGKMAFPGRAQLVVLCQTVIPENIPKSNII